MNQWVNTWTKLVIHTFSYPMKYLTHFLKKQKQWILFRLMYYYFILWTPFDGWYCIKSRLSRWKRFLFLGLIHFFIIWYLPLPLQIIGHNQDKSLLQAGLITAFLRFKFQFKGLWEGCNLNFPKIRDYSESVMLNIFCLLQVKNIQFGAWHRS